MTNRPDAPREDRDSDALDRWLAELADTPAVPLDAALAERLMADALSVMPAVAPSPVPRRDGWLVRLGLALDAALSRAPGIAGLAAAGLAGVWIGFAPPTPAAEVTNLFWQGAAAISPVFEPLIDSAPYILIPDADFPEVEP